MAKQDQSKDGFMAVILKREIQRSLCGNILQTGTSLYMYGISLMLMCLMHLCLCLPVATEVATALAAQA